MNEEKIQQDNSCNDSSGSNSDCCSSGAGNWKSWRTVVFILVLLAAGVLAAHSVLSNETNSSSGAGSAGVCPLNKVCSSGKTCGTNEANPGDVTCLLEKKADNPSSCCPKTGTPSCCPKTDIAGCCPKTGAGSGCPKAAAVPGCCPKTGSE